MIGQAKPAPQPQPVDADRTDVDKDAAQSPQGDADVASGAPPQREIGGREGPDPTRYGDWEKNGRCVDF